ncbi:MAG: hypothetical protein COB59_06890 [Rhodospirillaceae bacterium]|nr:MAG: hypothetical protein COB59_06890 [Rhodospirillaceae bacterium]
MWKTYNAAGFLEYSFAETVAAMFPYYVIRTTGGILFFAGALVMAYNVYRTITMTKEEEANIQTVPETQAAA